MSRNPDRLEFKKPNQPIAGVIFILIGAAALWPSFLSRFLSEFPTWVLFLTGVPFLLGGVWMTFGRSVISLDRQHRTVTTWWGLLVPFKTRTISLVEYKTVLISKEIRSTARKTRSNTKSHTYSRSAPQTVYPIKLICEEDPPEAAIVAALSGDGGAFDRVKRLRDFGVRMHELERTRKERGMASIRIDEPINLTAARAKARRIGEFLGFEIRDLNSHEG